MGLRKQVGERLSGFVLETIAGESLALPWASGWTHLQFRRFAGCPVCNLHMRALTERRNDLEASGVHEVLFFHSSKDALTPYQADIPFPTVADPGRVYYDQFGVERSAAALLHPRTALAAVLGLSAANLMAAVSLKEDHAGLPAEFLIDSVGIIRDLKYGRHPADQWSVDEILARAAPVT